MSAERAPARGIGLDAGALVALERGDPRLRALLQEAGRHEMPIHVTAGVVAQVWRGGARQARVARVLAAPEVLVVDLDEVTARAVGVLSGRSGHTDIVDVHVALDAMMHGHRVVTSDPADLRAVAPSLALIEV